MKFVTYGKQFIYLLAIAVIFGFIVKSTRVGDFARPKPLQPEERATSSSPTSTIKEVVDEPKGTTTSSSTLSKPLVKDMISVNHISSSAGSPLIVTGKARGQWYFEASFPAELRDGDGKVIAVSPAKAEGDWMTTEFVPFALTLRFSPPKTKTGTLILKKDNPSGLPEHDASLTIPVTFRTISGTSQDTALYVGFISEKDASNKDCTSVLSSPRLVPKTLATANAAITELLKGPTLGEIGDGMLTLIPSNTELKSLKITNGTAYADFTEKLNSGVAGSCKVGAIRAQIEETLKQFPTVQDVIISVNGKSEGILEP